jgi:hypothetical protein
MFDQSLFEYLQAASRLGYTEFQLSVTKLSLGSVRLVIHPLNQKGNPLCEDEKALDAILEADPLSGNTECVDVSWDDEGWALQTAA